MFNFPPHTISGAVLLNAQPLAVHTSSPASWLFTAVVIWIGILVFLRISNLFR